MHLPKVVFEDIRLTREVDWIYGFLFYNEWGWGKYILKKHPRLKRLYNIPYRRDRIEFLHQYISMFRGAHFDDLRAAGLRYAKPWQKKEKEYFTLLSQIIGTEWPTNRRKIRALISINPICPRFLKEWSFSIFFKYKKMSHAIEVIMHESCHFLYFKKWLEMYPETDKKHFESPHLEWHLSELVAPIILNDPRVRKFLKTKAVFYTEYFKIKIGGKTAPAYFTALYKKYIGQKNGFEKFLAAAWRKMKENEKKFNIK